jgi:hypothetical protein
MTRAVAIAVVATFMVGACSLVRNDPAVVPGGDGPMVTECEPPLAFEGETTIAELGLADAMQLDEVTASRRGEISITRDTVTWQEFAPPDVPAVVPAGQMLCITWPDGTGMTGLLSVPFPAAAAEGGPDAAGAFPVVPILVGFALLAAVALSWLAFRRDAPAA